MMAMDVTDDCKSMEVLIEGDNNVEQLCKEHSKVVSSKVCKTRLTRIPKVHQFWCPTNHWKENITLFSTPKTRQKMGSSLESYGKHIVDNLQNTINWKTIMQ